MKRMFWAVLLISMVAVFPGCQEEIEEPTSRGPLQKEKVKGFVRPSELEAKEPDVSRGLVGWWKFDEVSGTKAADSSGHGRDGTVKGSLSFDSGSVKGRIGKALNIGSGGDYIEITGYKGITGTAARTVAAWIKTKRDSGQILSWGRDEGGQMFIFGFIRGRGRVGVTPKGGYLYMNDKVSDDQWHHLAAVVREAEPPNLHDDVTLYKDGQIALIHSIGLLDLWPIDTPGGLDVAIGKDFEGVIDEVRIYDRALSEGEIRLLFASK